MKNFKTKFKKKKKKEEEEEELIGKFVNSSK